MTKARKTIRSELIDQLGEVGKVAVRELVGIIREHLATAQKIRKEVEIEEYNLIEANAGQDKRIDDNVRKHFATLHERVRNVIVQTARTLKDAHYKTCSDAVDGFQLSRSQEQQARTLIDA